MSALDPVPAARSSRRTGALTAGNTPSQISLGRFDTDPDRAPVSGESPRLMGVHVRRVHKAPMRIDIDISSSHCTGWCTAPRHAVVDLLTLLCGVDMDRHRCTAARLARAKSTNWASSAGATARRLLCGAMPSVSSKAATAEEFKVTFDVVNGADAAPWRRGAALKSRCA